MMYLDWLKDSQEKLSQVKRSSNMRRKIKKEVLKQPQILLNDKECVTYLQNLEMMGHFAGWIPYFNSFSLFTQMRRILFY